MSRPRVLFLSHVLPQPPDGGVKIRTHHLLRILARDFSVDALCFFRQAARSDPGDIERAMEALEKYADHVEAFPIPQEESTVRLLWDHVRSTLRRRPYTVFSYESRRYLERLDDALERNSYDLVHVDSLDLSRYLEQISDVPVVCDHHNVESELLRKRAESVGFPPTRMYLRMQADLLAREEEHWCPRVALNVTVSERDRDSLSQRIPDASYTVVPNGVDTEAFSPSEQERGDTESGLVFVGGCTWFPNRDALEFFATDILPIIREFRSDVRVRWVGRAEENTLSHYSQKYGIEMTGYVDDIRPYVHDAACYVVPIRVGGGTRLKILDAWAMGKAVVSTSQGCEGLDARDGENILIRDSSEGFAEAVDRVLSNGELRFRLGQEGRRTAERTYSWKVIGERMNAAYRRLLSAEDHAFES